MQSLNHWFCHQGYHFFFKNHWCPILPKVGLRSDTTLNQQINQRPNSAAGYHVALSSLPNNCTKSIKVLQLKQCFRSGMFIPDLNFFHSGSRIRIKEFKYFKPNVVSKLSELKCDPDPDFYTSRIPAQNGTGSPIRNCVKKLLS